MNCAEALQQLCQKIARITFAADYISSSVPKTMEVKKEMIMALAIQQFEATHQCLQFKVRAETHAITKYFFTCKNLPLYVVSLLHPKNVDNTNSQSLPVATLYQEALLLSRNGVMLPIPLK